MTNALTIGYFADGPWSHLALAKILADPAIKVAFICARHQHPDPVLKARAAEKDLPFLTSADINSDAFYEIAAAHRCDLFVSMSFNQIFRKRLIEQPPLTAINCHAGKLPFYRGRNILNWALINDEREFGVTVHYIDDGIDTGDIILQSLLPISDEDTYGTLLSRAYAECAGLLYDALTRLRNGTAPRISQSSIHPTGFYCTGRGEGDERLDWNQTSREVFNFVRALANPGPDARCRLGGAEIRIVRVETVRDAPCYKGVPGAVVGVDRDSFLVKTADSFVRVTEWSGQSRPKIGDRLV